ncbi:unnamed protein product [Vitrella brassicaformis CCMP3155]|uniref:Rieske domain-containing protein n=1 Tax=Vitrella brassicaformis (strain CCMP3155) TaxID=1169540 RepID=A0A0G4EN43_VITBC|nr:unnamed protein product [Vitrella brassicaformis CCMP3155]|mmetsp:Transcript_5772/g.13800  ORF Transcript_5772/g.13800 Transcript_5772/m.13800 type:complete len:229 (-) Transcript_5772:1242-1928(-)|eukprot:CEL99257.1 unnamed protein product [Vitrella brassicaformis CCMP3155]
MSSHSLGGPTSPKHAAAPEVDNQGVPWFKTVPLKTLGVRPTLVVVSGRPVALFLYNGCVYAIDANCYHAGGPLYQAEDIEDIAGQPCIRCPHHSFIISVSTGESFYQPVTFQKEEGEDGHEHLKPIVGEWQTKGPKQRTHRTKVQGEGDDESVYVSLSDLFHSMPSDQFAKLRHPLAPAPVPDIQAKWEGDGMEQHHHSPRHGGHHSPSHAHGQGQHPHPPLPPVQGE